MYPRNINLSNSNSFFIFGARGTGKTTTLNSFFSNKSVLKIDLLQDRFFSELQGHPSRLADIISQEKKEWIMIDEIQKVPALLDEVHSLIQSQKLKFALTGSSARKLKRGSSNLLAGRAFVFKMYPLTHLELENSFILDQILAFGSLPGIFSLPETRDKILFLRSYAETYLKEEILIEQIIRKLPPFRRFLEISARQDTEIVSYSNIGRDIDLDPKIISNYYGILEDTLLGFLLESYHTSIRKKQKKAPKFYWFDLGVRRILAGTIDQPVTPQSFEYGSLFESFIINEIYRLMVYSEKSHNLSFVRVDDKLETDLIIERTGIPTYVIEIKSSDRIHEGHVEGCKKIAKNIKNSIPMVLSRDPMAKKIEGVSCLYWKDGIVEILNPPR